jgi:hypothetical protein
MKPALATVCSLDASVATILEDYAAGQCDSVDLWLGHAEGLLAERGPAALSDLLSRHGITAAAAGCSPARERRGWSTGSISRAGWPCCGRWGFRCW